MLPVALCTTYQPRHRLDGPLHVEPKLDGVRCLIGSGIEGAAAHARSGMVLHGAQDLVDMVGRALDLTRYVLDGEVVLPGRCCEEAHGAACRPGEHGALQFWAFDLLAAGDWHARTSPTFQERRDTLERLLPVSDRVVLVPSPRVENLDGPGLRAWRDKYLADGFEGTVVKRAGDRYPFGRSNGWLRAKRVQTIDGIVRAVHLGRLGLSSLEVELPGGALVKVGSGFSDRRRADVARWQAAIGHHVEVRYQDRLPRGGLRFASFVQFRTDLDGDTSAYPSIRRRARHLCLVA